MRIAHMLCNFKAERQQEFDLQGDCSSSELILVDSEGEGPSHPTPLPSTYKRKVLFVCLFVSFLLIPSRLFFHCSRSVFIVFHVSRLVFRGSRSVFMVPGWFSWFFMVQGWFFIVFIQNVPA